MPMSQIFISRSSGMPSKRYTHGAIPTYVCSCGFIARPGERVGEQLIKAHETCPTIPPLDLYKRGMIKACNDIRMKTLKDEECKTRKRHQVDIDAEDEEINVHQAQEVIDLTSNSVHQKEEEEEEEEEAEEEEEEEEEAITVNITEEMLALAQQPTPPSPPQQIKLRTEWLVVENMRRIDKLTEMVQSLTGEN